MGQKGERALMYVCGGSHGMAWQWHENHVKRSDHLIDDDEGSIELIENFLIV